MLPSRQWTDLTAADFEQTNVADVVAVVPLAAIEQHGPHLPLGTDAYIMDGYLARVLERLPADLPAVFLPTQSIGCSPEHAAFPGTLSLSPRVALEAWGALIGALAASGVQKVVVVNAHGGNSSIVELLARQGRSEHGLFVGLCSWARFGYPPGLFDDVERDHGVHGGQIETSLMLAFRPDLVRMDRAENFASASVGIERSHTWIRVSGRPTGFGWMAQDLNEAGVVGNAAAATAAMGEACAAFGAAAFIDYLREVCAFDQSFR